MKRLNQIIMVTCLLGLMLPSTVMAAKADGKKAKLIAKYDKNGNGTIDGDEMDAFRKDFKADKEGQLKAYDKDGDGTLSDEEIQAIKPGANKKAKAPGATKKSKKENGQDKGKSEKSEKPKQQGDPGQSGDGGGSKAAE